MRGGGEENEKEYRVAQDRGCLDMAFAAHSESTPSKERQREYEAQRFRFRLRKHDGRIPLCTTVLVVFAVGFGAM